MKLVQERCVGCGQCYPYCPAHAISRDSQTGKSRIDEERCLECHVCLRSKVCPVQAFEIEPLEYPRSLRSVFSDVLSPHKSTGVLGRGTEEMKTNDVTGRLKSGVLGVSVELGRPGLGTTFADLQTVAQAVSAIGVVFEESNPVAGLMIDKSRGLFAPEILNERVLSALLEFQIPQERLAELISALHAVEPRIDTVFSVGVSMRMPQGACGNPLEDYCREHGIYCRPNGKTNVGLGRPLFHEAAS